MYVFKEKQLFRQKFTFILLIAISIFSMYSAFNYVWEHMEEMNMLQFFVLLLPLGVAFLIGNITLTTKIDEQGIHYRFFPFHLKFKNVAWNDLENCNVRTYNPITEYGGWGYRISILRKKGHAFTVNGKTGLQLELKNGKKILIGTQKGADITRIIERYFKKNKSAEQDN